MGDLQRALDLLHSDNVTPKLDWGTVAILRSDLPLIVVKSEVFTLLSWKSLQKWERQGPSLHHWNKYSFQLQADYSLYPKNQTWPPKFTLLKITFGLLKEVVHFSKAAAMDCSSLYKQCLCHFKSMKWHAASAAVLPISSHEVTDHIWYFIYSQFCSDLKFASNICRWSKSQPPAPQTIVALLSCLCRSRPRSQNCSDSNAHTNQNQLQFLLKNSLNVFKVQQLLS